jgi:hypothetical protein
MNRRNFFKSLGIGAVATVSEAIPVPKEKPRYMDWEFAKKEIDSALKQLANFNNLGELKPKNNAVEVACAAKIKSILLKCEPEQVVGWCLEFTSMDATFYENIGDYTFDFLCNDDDIYNICKSVVDKK